MELLYMLRVTCALLLSAKSLPGKLVTPSPSLTETCPVFCFSCDIFGVFPFKMKWIIFPYLWRKCLFWFCIEVLEALLVGLGIRTGESFLLFSFCDSLSSPVRPCTEWLSSELWSRPFHNHTASAFTSQWLHPCPEKWFVFCRARAY